MFDYIKKWYNMKLWTKDMVKSAVVHNQITKKQYKEIVDEDYE